MKKALKTCFRVLAWLYPLSIWLLHDHVNLKPLGLGLFALFTLDWLITMPAARRPRAALGVALALAAILLLNPERAVRLYPFLMASSMLYMFIRTRDPEDNPMIGPMRRFMVLDKGLLQLLHRAKRLWIVGLGINCLVFLVFLFAFDNKTWALYASFYSYLWLLLLFVLTVIIIAVQMRRLP